MATKIETLELEILANSTSASLGLNALVTSLNKIKNAARGGLGLTGVASEIRDVSSSMKDINQSNKDTTRSFTDLFYKATGVSRAFKKIGNAIWSTIEKSSDYTETLNLFNVSMGKYAGTSEEITAEIREALGDTTAEWKGAMQYAEEVSAAMGIDTEEWMEAQGIFMTLATGFGVASSRAAVMSKNLTQLSYDLSSFYNMDVETAFLKLKSGLAGELEPLRAIGYDLSQAKLEATALELGIDKAISSMTQAEKAELRYYAIMTQVTQTHGDMARTLDDPANQLRVLKAEVNMAAREIGNLFIPALNAILPYAISAAKVIGVLAQSIAGAFGIRKNDGTEEAVENTNAVTQNLSEAQDEAKKLKSYMLGIDELNVINPNASETDGSSFTFDLPDYDFMELLVESKVSAITEKAKEWLGISEEINSVSELLATNFGNILISVGAIGIALIAWNIASIFTDATKLLKAIKALRKVMTLMGTTLKVLGIAGVIAGATAGAVWLFNHTEDTLTKIGAVISAASLGVGAILAFTGVNVPLGIALMAVGAVSMVSAIAMNTTALSDEIKGIIGVITGVVSVALLAVGAILAFTGVNIPLGIALLAGGAMTLATAVIPNWDTIKTALEGPVGGITALVGGASLALGAILAFTGASLPIGIALMVTGAAGLVTAVAVNWETIKTALESPIGGITALVGGAVLALGAILAFTGANIPLGIGLMVAGAASLATVVALNWNSIVEALQSPIGLITAIVGGALLALGAVLLFTGAGIPLGLGLMAVGAAGLATAIAANWNNIVDALRGPVGLITGIISGALLVLGVIMLFTGAGIPLGLGLMAAGAGGLAAALAPNWNFLVDKIKDIWSDITSFWRSTIAPVFTKEWWGNLGKTCMNGLIGGIEAGINWIIGAFENMINWIVDGLNSLSFDIPEWLGGGTFGLNLERVSFNKVSIPRFADGAYDVPSGQMFIAREAGAEMVGTIGRKTAVANNDQIVAGIAGGVASANEEQNALLREQNSLLRAILDKDSGVYLDGKNLTNSVEKYQRERGRNLITGGVI